MALDSWKSRLAFVSAAFILFLAIAFNGKTPASADIHTEMMVLLEGNRAASDEVFDSLKERGKDDAVPALILLKRFLTKNPKLDAALATLTGVAGDRSWHDWMLWQQATPQIKPHDGFAAFKSALYQRIDPNFRVFLHDGVEHEIRLEEIAWGGVIKDGIPALTNPALIDAKDADYMTDGELVFGVSINGDSRAYPLRMMDWHEMFNDVIGGVPVSLAYCTLCGSGILFETRVDERKKPFVFGSSGFLYRSNKLMYDSETHSLWNQFTGRPVVGSLVGSGIELKTRPVVITDWKRWKQAHPHTKVLSRETGFDRDYSPGAAYSEYFASPDLMFPAIIERRDLHAKDQIFALRSAGTDKAWPLSLFSKGKVINDHAGVLDLVLIGDASTQTVRAFRAEGRDFFRTSDLTEVSDLSGGTWQVTEEALIGPSGERLTRLPGHIAYWFAWAGYLGTDGELAAAQKATK